MLRLRPFALVGWILMVMSCRKAEPDEIVSPRRRTPEPTSTPFLHGGSPATTSVPGAGGSDAAGAGAGNLAGTGNLTGASAESDCATHLRQVPGPFTKLKLLESVAGCAMVHYCRFARAAERLRDAAAPSALAGTDANRASAQRAWLEAMTAWETSEVFRFGPAAPAPQGQDYRDRIYSWPRDGRCKTDEQTVSRFYLDGAFSGSPSQSFVAGRSLAAIEYLLFYADGDNGCNQYSSINATGAWSTTPGDELKRRKLEYAAAASDDVWKSATLLLDAWLPDRGNFYRQMTTPGPNGVFPDEQTALNAVNWGLFYLDQEVKDWKLAIPMGLSVDCPAASCPDRIESRYASVTVPGLANRHLQANLVGFRRLFQGCGDNYAGIGFDDWLAAVGAEGLANRMLSAMDAAEVAINRLELPLEQAVVSRPEAAMAVYDAIKAISDPLKSEFLSVLNLGIPKGSETDND